MDLLDIEILREIGKSQALSPFPSTVSSLRKIGRTLGVDKDTVRNRLGVLKAKGVLVGWHSLVNPNLLSMKATRVWLEYPSEKEKEEGVKKLALTTNVRAVNNYVGNCASFVIVHDMRESSEDQLEKAGIEASVRVRLLATMKFPASSLTLTASDWGIYRSIRDNPQKPLRIISIETGLSLRTVKRRMQRFAEENAVLVAPDLNPKLLAGVPAELLVKCNETTINEVTRHISKTGVDCVFHQEQFAEPCALFSIVPNNISRAQEIHHISKEQPGVEESGLFFLQDVVRPREPLRMSRSQDAN